MNELAEQLRAEVYSCKACEKTGVFTRSQSSGRFFKFPPIIGAHGETELLFIGINPRRSDTNIELHDWLMTSAEAFASLSHNQLQDKKRYIYLDGKDKQDATEKRDGKETHYDCHMIVIQEVFECNCHFESKAAVTELYLCASRSAPASIERTKSPCAERYLKRVVDLAKPRVVIAVGSTVRKHIEAHFLRAIHVPLVQMIHPRYLYGKTIAEKKYALRPVIEQIRKILGFGTPPSPT